MFLLVKEYTTCWNEKSRMNFRYRTISFVRYIPLPFPVYESPGNRHERNLLFTDAPRCDVAHTALPGRQPLVAMIPPGATIFSSRSSQYAAGLTLAQTLANKQDIATLLDRLSIIACRAGVMGRQSASVNRALPYSGRSAIVLG